MDLSSIPYIHRDITWLSFNYRVLQEAKDPTVPLLERLKFLAIYSSNLDEYFRVRVAYIKSLINLGKKTKKAFNFKPKVILEKIHQIVNAQQEEFSIIFHKQVLPALERYHIHLIQPEELTAAHRDFVDAYFKENLISYVQPVLLVKQKIRPFLNNAALYLAVVLRTKSDNIRYAVVKIPSDDLPRFLTLPSSSPERKEVIALDDIVRASIPNLFPGYKVEEAYSVKLTRDAELYIDDEFSGDLIEKIKTSLSKRNIGPGTRFVFDRTMPKPLLDFLVETFSLKKRDMQPEGRYHNNFDLFKFPQFGLDQLKDNPLPPLRCPSLEQQDSLFDSIRTQDHFVHFPYQRYDYVLQLFKEAAADPKVTHIKIIQYRVAKHSAIMTAMKKAVDSGKQVTVFIEVKARFDEEANLQWAEKLESWGVRVLYSFPGLKVHSKLALICRIEEGQLQNYCYLSTGNFNEDTARIYEDFGLFTADERLTSEVARLFSYLETVKKPNRPFKHLLVGQFGMRETLYKYIDYEIEQAKANKACGISIKVNSIEERTIIGKLYEASQAGVPVKIVVRGICCIQPGVKGFSENIEAISIVDRFLEHSRIYRFHHGGKDLMYLSSADWMTRNLQHRIECGFPIYDAKLRQQLSHYMEILWSDNVKARIMNAEQDNQYRRGEEEHSFRSQIETYSYYKSKLEQAPLS